MKKILTRTAVEFIILQLAFFSGQNLSTYAGPANETQSSSQAENQESGESEYSGIEYYDLTIADPVVLPAELYSYDQMTADMQALASRYPDRVRTEKIGESPDGRAIYDIIVGNPKAEKKILLQGAIHAREYIVTPLMMQQIEYLLAGYDTGFYDGKPLSDLLDQTAVHFVPMVNPDGVAISQMGEEGIRSKELQKVLREAYASDVAAGRTGEDYGSYLRHWKSNARGVDLNLNFDAEWSGIYPEIQSAASVGYRGTAPLSEPETKALADLAGKYTFSSTISYHSTGSVIFWNTRENKKEAESLQMAQLASQITGYPVRNGMGSGGFKDWMQRSNSVPGITLEVGYSNCPIPFSEYAGIWNRNRQIPAAFAQLALTQAVK